MFYIGTLKDSIKQKEWTRNRLTLIGTKSQIQNSYLDSGIMFTIANAPTHLHA